MKNESGWIDATKEFGPEFKKVWAYQGYTFSKTLNEYVVSTVGLVSKTAKEDRFLAYCLMDCLPLGRFYHASQGKKKVLAYLVKEALTG